MTKLLLTDDQINILLFEESNTEDRGQLNNKIISDGSSDEDVDSTGNIFRQKNY